VLTRGGPYGKPVMVMETAFSALELDKYLWNPASTTQSSTSAELQKWSQACPTEGSGIFWWAAEYQATIRFTASRGLIDVVFFGGTVAMCFLWAGRLWFADLPLHHASLSDNALVLRVAAERRGHEPENHP